MKKLIESQHMQNINMFSVMFLYPRNRQKSGKPTPASLNGSPDTYWFFILVPVYRIAGETVEDFKENNAHCSLWVEPQLIMLLLPLDKLSDV